MSSKDLCLSFESTDLEFDVSDTWVEQISLQLAEMMYCVFTHGSAPFCIEELFDSIDIICRNGKEEELIHRFVYCMDQHAIKFRDSIVALLDLETTRFMSEVSQIWDTAFENIRTASSFLIYCACGIQTIFQLALDSFSRSILASPRARDINLKLCESVVSGAMSLKQSHLYHFLKYPINFDDEPFTRLRGEALTRLHSELAAQLLEISQGSMIVMSLEEMSSLELSISTLIYMTNALHLCSNEMSALLMEATTKYYKEQSVVLMEKLSLPLYIRFIFITLDVEMGLTMDCLKGLNRSSVRSIVFRYLVSTQIKRILDDRLHTEIRQGNACLMTDMYLLLNEMGIMKDFYLFVRKNIEDLGVSLPKDQSFIASIIKYYELFARYLKDCWFNDTGFIATVRDAFADIVNRQYDSLKPVSLFVEYVDDLLCSAPVAATPRVIPETVDVDSPDYRVVPSAVNMKQFLDMFGLITDKDEFENEYRRSLANRLVTNGIMQWAQEHQLTDEMSRICGHIYVERMNIMLEDMKTTNNYNNKLSTSSSVPSFPIPSYFNIITKGNWPDTNPVVWNIPSDIDTTRRLFEKHYTDENKDRRIAFVFPISQVTLNYSKGETTYEFVVSFAQFLVLREFNSRNSISLTALMQATNMSRDEVITACIGLCSGEHNILFKTGNVDDVEDADEFSVNDSFASTSTLVNFSRARVLRAYRNNDMSEELLLNVRRVKLDACIMRILKKIKSAMFDQLLADCTSAGLDFQPDVQFMKERVESLISKEYLERNPDNVNELVYQP